MSIWTPLKEVRDFFISLFRKDFPAVADLAARLSTDEMKILWPLLVQKAALIVAGQITLDEAVIDIAKTGRDVAIKDIRDALGLQSRYVKGAK